jgi:outer membrane receptor protein involved in Fe transport
MRPTIALVGLAALCCGAVGVAQETTGDIVGTVSSPDGQPMPGVTVTISDPARGFERIVVSNREGRFRLTALPPARYVLTADLDGFKTLQRELDVDLGRTTSGDITMELGAFSDTIEVTGERPRVDPASTVAGITVNTDELNARLPIAREATELALLAPGTVSGSSDFNPGINTQGDSTLYTPGQRLISMMGASVAENTYAVNGLNITNFRNGLGSSRVPLEFIEEVQVKTGGYEAEFGRATGGVINMVTKSGTNTLTGAASAYFRPEGLQESMANTIYNTREEERLERLEVNASVGGTLVRDRLFYFLAVSYTDEDLLTMDTRHGERWQSQEPYWGGKLDWYISPSHRLEGTYFTDETEVYRTLLLYDEDEGLGEVLNTGWFFRGGSNAIAKYTGVLSDRVLVSAQYGFNEFDRTNRSSGDECPIAVDERYGPAERSGCWLSAFVGTNSDEREAYRVDVDLFVGRHSLRAGLDAEENLSSALETYSGGVYYRYYLNGAEGQDPEDYRFPELPWHRELVRVRSWREGGNYPTDSQSAYLQDRWAVTPSLTLTLGVRYELYDNGNSAGESFIRIADQWAPRVGAVWDPTGNGRSKLYGNYALYHLPVASNTNVMLGGGQFFDEIWYTFSGGVDPVTGEPGRLEDELRYRLLMDGVVPDPREVTADTIEPMSQWEAILGYERMIGESWSVGVRGTAREFNEIIEDVWLARALWEVYGVDCLSPDLMWDPFEGCFWPQHPTARLMNPGTGFTGWYDLDGDGVLDPISFTREQMNLPEPERRYFSLELSVARRFAGNWMFRGSYTWSHSYGNYEGWVNSDIIQDYAGLTATWDISGIMEHAKGDLPNDRRHSLKLFGMYSWDAGLGIGANLWYRSGRPINGFGYHPSDPWAEAYDPMSFYKLGEPCQRGCGGTTEDAWSLSLMLRYDWRWAGTEWHVRVDAFNLFDNGATTAVDEWAEDDRNVLSDTYLEPIDYQTPRRVRFGVGVSF